MGINNPLDFTSYQLKEGMHKEMSHFIPPKRFLTNHIHLETKENNCIMSIFLTTYMQRIP